MAEIPEVERFPTPAPEQVRHVEQLSGDAHRLEEALRALRRERPPHDHNIVLAHTHAETLAAILDEWRSLADREER